MSVITPPRPPRGIFPAPTEENQLTTDIWYSDLEDYGQDPDQCPVIDASQIPPRPPVKKDQTGDHTENEIDEIPEFHEQVLSMSIFSEAEQLDVYTNAVLRAPYFEATQAGIADLLPHLTDGLLKYVPELNEWIIHDGRTFIKQPGIEIQIIRKALFAAENAAGHDATRRRNLLALEKFSAIKGIAQIAASSPLFMVHLDRFDADPERINTPGGYLNLRTLEMEPNRPEHFCMKCTGFAPDFDVTAPVFQKFSLEVAGGDQDLSFWKICRNGYELTGETFEQDFCIKPGRGSNGKGAEGRLELAVWGSYAVEISPKLLMEQQDGGSASPELLDIVGKRKILASETEDGARLNTALIKGLTGDDQIRARALYSNSIASFRNIGKISLRTNHAPTVRRMDAAMRRRIKIIPYPATFSEDSKDPKMLEKLLLEGPAIFGMFCQAAQAYLLAVGLPKCKTVLAESMDFCNEQDPIGRFIAERCEISPEFVTPSRDLFNSFCEWMEAEGSPKWSLTGFGRALTERGFMPGTRNTRIKCRKGIRLCL